MGPLDRTAEVARARAFVHGAAGTWSEDAVVALAALVRLGEPAELLELARSSVAAAAEGRRGARKERPATTDGAWALAETLGMWRALGIAYACRTLPAPHDAFEALER